MKKPKNNLKVKVERLIPGSQGEVFKAWLNPKVPGTTWYENQKLILNPKVNGMFFWLIHSTPHYGRFIEIKKPARIQYTWMSPYTFGYESKVTVTFKKKGKETLMTLVHSGLPNDEGGKGHEGGWTYFMDKLQKHFSK